jgi:RHS repeat-associated protein
VLTYSYTHGKVTGISVNGVSLLNNVLYEPFGPTNGWAWGNGTLAARIYDADGKVTQIDSAGLKTYGYDDAFRITRATDASTSANSWVYGYDPLDRLTNASNAAVSQVYTFDENGNRLSQTGTSNTTFAYPIGSNKLSSAAGSLTKTYNYDAAGNILSDGTIVYAYNNRGRMKTAKNGAASMVTYTYDGFGQRIKKTGTTRIFVYDEAGHLQGEYNSSGVMVQEFVWLGEIPVAVLTPKTGGVNIFYIHTDHLNTPRKITRPSDNKLRWTYNPDPYGNGAPNNNPQALGAFTFNLRFPGQYFDAETGNHYNYYRDYSPSTGRYLQSDPIGLMGGVNTFGYADGNPLHSFDPFGLFSFRDGLSFVPVVGSALDAYDAFKCGNIGAGLLNTGLAIMDATGAGALVKGLAVGTMKWSSRKGISDAYKNSNNWAAMRRELQKQGEIPRNSMSTPRGDWITTDHIFTKQSSGAPHSRLNHPANLQTGVPQWLNSAYEGMGPLERARHLPKWMKGAAGGAASYVGGLFTGSGDTCGCP